MRKTGWSPLAILSVRYLILYGKYSNHKTVHGLFWQLYFSSLTVFSSVLMKEKCYATAETMSAEHGITSKLQWPGEDKVDLSGLKRQCTEACRVNMLAWHSCLPTHQIEGEDEIQDAQHFQGHQQDACDNQSGVLLPGLPSPAQISILIISGESFVTSISQI